MLLPVIMYFSSKSNRKVLYKRILLFYFLYSIFNELLNNFSYSRYPDLYFWNGIFFAILKIFLICFIFYSISSSTLLKKLTIISFFTYLSFLLILSIFFNNTSDYNKIPSSVQGIILLILSITFFYEKMKAPDTLFIYSLPEFWYVVAIFIYSSGTFFIYVFAEFWLENKSNIDDYTVIHSFISILTNIIIGYSMWKQSKEKQLTSLKANIL